MRGLVQLSGCSINLKYCMPLVYTDGGAHSRLNLVLGKVGFVRAALQYI